MGSQTREEALRVGRTGAPRQGRCGRAGECNRVRGGTLQGGHRERLSSFSAEMPDRYVSQLHVRPHCKGERLNFGKAAPDVCCKKRSRLVVV
jgi:hypothetical protein